jgi:short-subunit dehydrogenase
LPQLRLAQTPLVENVGSVLGHTAVPGKSEYCASKFALHGLTDALRIELGREGIDVLLVSPSTTSSEFFDVAIGSTPGTTALKDAMSAEAVAHRIVAAMRSGRREIILSATGKLLVWLDRLCPPLASWALRRWG